MTATISADASNILRPQFRQRPVPPTPRLAGEPIPDEALPAISMGMSIQLLETVMRRILDEGGPELLAIAIDEARSRVK